MSIELRVRVSKLERDLEDLSQRVEHIMKLLSPAQVQDSPLEESSPAPKRSILNVGKGNKK
jgi:hypothetical protein